MTQKFNLQFTHHLSDSQVSTPPLPIFIDTFGSYPRFSSWIEIPSAVVNNEPTIAGCDDYSVVNEYIRLICQFLNDREVPITLYEGVVHSNDSYKTITILDTINNFLLNIGSSGLTFYLLHSLEHSLIGKELYDYLLTLREKFLPSKEATVNFIQDSNGLRVVRLPFNSKEKFSLTQYNDDFAEVDTKIMETLNRPKSKGLIILHGEPGTGKTCYIKNIIKTCKRDVYYIPPDLAHHLSTPAFINFMMHELVNSVLLIEDAENILKPREIGASQAVSNILNITDGILGDMVTSTIVVTVNCPLNHLDSALLRPGRLMASYDFRKLETIKASVLMRELYGRDATEPMTLAEIFNATDLPTNNEKEKTKFGFV